jgi:glycosyltransferase involved in cell wall biosynthesis
VALRILVMVSRDPANPYLGGGELVFAEWSRELVRAGHSVDYLCSTFPGATPEGEFDGVRVHRIADERVLGVAAFAEYERQYRGRVDVILEDILGGSRLPFFAPVYAREPVVGAWFQDHGPIFRNQYPRPLWPVLDTLERALVRAHRRSVVLVPSEQSALSYKAKGGNALRVRLYRPGLPRSVLDLGEPPDYASRKPWIVHLGKIRRYKCAHQSIEVLARLLTRLPSVELFIVGRMGQPKYLNELRQLAAARGVAERVHFEVNVPEGRKIELLRSSRVLVSPAPVEGFGIAVAEAGACGLPVVGTEGIPGDVLEEGANGFRVPFGDVPAMADRALRLLTEPELFRAQSQNGYARAHHLTWSESTQPLLVVLKELEISVRERGPASRPDRST